MKRALGLVLSAATILALSGCAGRSPGVARTAPAGGAREEAMRFLENRTEEIHTVRAGVELHWTSPELQAPVSCRASLVFEAPDRLRLRGTSKAFFTIFDLVAGPEEIRIDIPHEKVLIRGTRGDPEWSRFALDPDLVTVALFAHPFPQGDGTLEVCEKDADFLWKGDGAWMVIDGAIGRPIHFRREEPRTDIVWEKWDEIEGIAWPRHVQLDWPDEGGKLEIDFWSVQLERPVRKGYFNEQPEGDREVLTPGQGIERWAEMLEAESEELSRE